MEPRTSSLEYTWLPTRVWSNTLGPWLYQQVFSKRSYSGSKRSNTANGVQKTSGAEKKIENEIKRV